MRVLQLFSLLIAMILSPMWASTQNQVYYDISQEVIEGKSFTDYAFFKDVSTDISDLEIDRSVLETGVQAELDMLSMRQLIAEKPSHIMMAVPQADGTTVQVRLMRHSIFAESFILRDSKTKKALAYDQGLHYKGIIDGEKSSIAAFSFFPTEIMGLVSSDAGSLVIGKQEGRPFTHLIYNDSDLKVQNPFDCETPDDGYIYTQKEINYSSTTKDVGDCIRLYIEIDNDIVNNKGGAVGATNYVTGLFNQSIILYSNDQIGMTINEIFAWTTTSPYSSTSSSGMLSDFQANTGAINGDLGHLVSYQASGGIAAGFSGICASNVDNSKCFSSIDASYANVPTYSWSVMVVTHEMGHLIGSRHTHACVWNGNGTAIDGCSGQTEGSCSLPGNPAGGGTIMSYCHLQSVGINLSLGFGPQPGNVVRGTVANATCLTSCGPGCNDGIQNGDETDVDCGGTECPACPTCDDGIQNGDEEGIDCGGTECPACPAVYCGSAGSNTQFEWIQSVSIGNFSNNSGNDGGYGDYLSLNVDADAGDSYAVSLSPGFAGTVYAEFWSIYIDLNGDVDFDDPGELVFQGNGTSTVSGNLTIPSSATLGTTRMRVSMLWNEYAGPCDLFVYGEVEDYSITIAAGGGPTCDDGIQNGDETGVDCGGTECPACPTCSDGVQNGDETGVDCGGTECPACPTCDDGIQNGDETGVDCGGSCAPCTSCNDGIQNGDETGVDCGGTECPACPTCDDGIQNGDETDVDCGGTECPACPTCDDGIQNGDETDVDCGGTECPACPTCSDGIQNGDETGVDCGGSCAPCNSGGCTYVTIDNNNFDSGWGIWNDGGSDCRRSNKDDAYANSGIFCVRLRDNTSTSTMTTDNLNLSSADEVTVDFSYIARSMDNSNEDFWLQVSTDGGSSYTTVEEWNRGDEFENLVREDGNAVINGPFTSNTRLRFRCDASGNSDWVYIDDVVITACENGSAQDEGETSLTDDNDDTTVEIDAEELRPVLTDIELYPVPTADYLAVQFDNSIEMQSSLYIIDMYGKVMLKQEFTPEVGAYQQQLDTSELPEGIYFVLVQQGDQMVTKRFVIIR